MYSIRFDDIIVIVFKYLRDFKDVFKYIKFFVEGEDVFWNDVIIF